MPEQKQNEHFDSGRATAPPSVCYSSQLGSSSEDYTHSSSTNSPEQNSVAVSQSPLYPLNFNNFVHQKTQSSPPTTSDYCLYSGSHPCYSSPTSKPNVNHLSFQPHYSTDYFTSSQTHSNSFSTINNFPPFINSNNNNNNSSNNNNNSSNNISNSNNTNFEFTSTSKSSPKIQEGFYATSESFDFQPSQQTSSASYNSAKISKSDSVPTLKHTANILFPTNTQSKYCQSKEPTDLFFEKNSKLKKSLEGTQNLIKTYKDDSFEEIQQFFAKNGAKIKNPQDTNQDLVTDSLLHLLYKKNSQDNLSYDVGDISPILVSLSSKHKAEEVAKLKKKEHIEDFKLMNDFLTKILSEKEEKRFKSLDDKKKALHKESFDDLGNELDDRKIKRDAMSHYQEDKNHQKKSSNYGDFNQWEYFGQQDIQSSNSHSRRGHFTFGGSSQQHSMGWSPMGIGMPRQSNPYYSNPHGHVMPAHAHSDYRYNQWNNPNHKNIPNVHNAHSQNTILPPSKADIKHHSEISNSVQDFGLAIGPTSEFSKYRAPSRDLMHRATSNLTEKSTRTGIHPDHLTPIPPAVRNSSSMRTPPISNHPKTVINNPLSDLQMLVTNQDGENLPQKADNFQQESVDLSAHSEMSKQKENLEEKSLNGNNKDVKEFRSPVSVIQIQNKQIKSDIKDSEKPVELTSKCTEKSVGIPVSPILGRNDVESKNVNSENVVEKLKETVQREAVKSCEEPIKTSVIVGKDEKPSLGDTKNKGDIPEDVQKKESEKEQKEENLTPEEKKETEEKEEPVPGELLDKKNNIDKTNEGDTEEAQKCKESVEEASDKLPGEVKGKSSENMESSRNCKRKAEEEQFSGEKKKVFLEVESQLEKMFQGVDAAENSDLPTVTSTSAESKPVVNEGIRKTPKKKPLRKSRIGRLSSGQSSGSERSLPCKKFKSSGNKEEGKKKVKKSLCDVMDRRGPFLHVEGSRESPASVIVVNFPKGDDEDEKEKNLAKKQILNSSRAKHHNELDYRGRSRNGLYSSTLSARYDAHTTDHTWICVFCKKGPHYNTMGDLFGPYIISKDENACLGDFSGDEKDISDAQKRGGRNKKSLRSNNMVEHFQKMSRKLRRTQSTESCLTGITMISDDQVDQLRYEVWVHEQCAVWSPNVFLIGSRIIGMQEAIWCSVKTVCSKCGISGANIGCVYRNCPNRSHYHCAKESGWSLEQDNFISTCHIHKTRS